MHASLDDVWDPQDKILKRPSIWRIYFLTFFSGGRFRRICLFILFLQNASNFLRLS